MREVAVIQTQLLCFSFSFPFSFCLSLFSFSPSQLFERKIHSNHSCHVRLATSCNCDVFVGTRNSNTTSKQRSPLQNSHSKRTFTHPSVIFYRYRLGELTLTVKFNPNIICCVHTFVYVQITVCIVFRVLSVCTCRHI